MTKKKNINLILIFLVLVLWGTVAYKSVHRYFFSDTNGKIEFANANKINFYHINKDTFNLKIINRDPFLNKESEVVKVIPPSSNIRKSIIISKPKIIKITEVVKWPTLSYYGYLKSKEKTEELILVKINNQLYKLRRNTTINGLVINKVYNDSIEVTFNKIKKIIYKD